MSRATAFVLSFLQKRFLNVIMEAMVYSRPVIFTRCPSVLNRIITGGVNGLLVSTEYVNALIEGIFRLIKDESLRTRLAETGRERAKDFKVEKMRRIKVAFITNIPAPYRIPLFNILDFKYNLKIKVFFSAWTHKNREWKVPNNINFEYKVLSGFNLPRSKNKENILHINPSLFFHLFKMHPDVIVSGGFSISSLISIVYSKIAGVPFILWSVDTTEARITKGYLATLIRKGTIKYSTKFVASGTATKKDLLHLGANSKDISIGIDTIDVEFFKSRSEKMRENKDLIRSEYKFPERLILFVGQLIKRKGVINLIKAFEIMRRRYSDVGLLLVGSGSEKKKLQSYCSENNIENVYFLGFRQGINLIKFFAVSDIFVFPTRRDVWGLVVNEAMAARLPVICSKFAGCAEDLIREGENGYLVDPENYEQVALYIERILLDKHLQGIMGRKSEEIIEGYTIKESANGFVEAIHNALKES